MTSSVWARFERDPREPTVAHLRAADADREVIHTVLAEAYAAGRLTQAEFEERTQLVLTSRTLGELPALVWDVVPPDPPGSAAMASLGSVSSPSNQLSPAVSVNLREKAEAKITSQRNQALGTFLFASVICWYIWLAAGAGFPWPLFVMLGTGWQLFSYLTSREDLVMRELERLEKREAKRLGRQQSAELPRGEEDPS